MWTVKPCASLGWGSGPTFRTRGPIECSSTPVCRWVKTVDCECIALGILLYVYIFVCPHNIGAILVARTFYQSCPICAFAQICFGHYLTGCYSCNLSFETPVNFIRTSSSARDTTLWNTGQPSMGRRFQKKKREIERIKTRSDKGTIIKGW